MNWRELIRLRFSQHWSLDLSIGPFILIALVVAGLVLVVMWRNRIRHLLGRFQVVRGTLSFGGLGQIEIRPNDDVIQIAHCAWVELATRKAGLPFDAENDVIEEVYSSWYQLFREMRRLASSCPVGRIAHDADTRKAIELIVDVLNKGLRPHLTMWQARFRRWYVNACRAEENRNRSPQEIQRLFPQYDVLVLDLAKTNSEMIEYMALLRRIATRDKDGGS